MSEGRVLLIEDEPALARGVSDMLRSRGFDVEGRRRRASMASTQSEAVRRRPPCCST